MEQYETLRADIAARMGKAFDALKKDLATLRTGRATPALLDSIVVEAYGEQMKIDQLGTVNAPEPRLLSINVWDRSMVKAIERAITDANMGLNPSNDGQLIRVPVPALNEERRNEMVKVAGKFTEQARIAVRNLRREANDAIKKMKNDKIMSEDEQARCEADIQKVTDEVIKQMDEALKAKEQEVRQV
jgi:ribosome recycling factor